MGTTNRDSEVSSARPKMLVRIVFALLLVQALAKTKPCDGKDNIDSCVCEDGETYEGFEELKGNCGRRNKPVSCECVDGSTWTPADRRRLAPCGTRRNLDECECHDGEIYSGRAIKRNCKKDDNPIAYCNCEDGTTWTPPRD